MGRQASKPPRVLSKSLRIKFSVTTPSLSRGDSCCMSCNDPFFSSLTLSRPVSESSMDQSRSSSTPSSLESGALGSNQIFASGTCIAEGEASIILEDGQSGAAVDRRSGTISSTNQVPMIVAPVSLSSLTGSLPIIHHPNDRSMCSTSKGNTTVAEFLYQLMKMLAEDNKDIIEWNDGKVMIHNPPKLASDVLRKYFRHSKYASFQRQLNYFGFRKTAGKGKMAPCTYVNAEVNSDLRSLLLIKVSV